jgi:hypothetical protein
VDNLWISYVKNDKGGRVHPERGGKFAPRETKWSISRSLPVGPRNVPVGPRGETG